MARIRYAAGIGIGLLIAEPGASPPDWIRQVAKDGATVVESRISRFEGDSSGGLLRIEFKATTTAPVALAALEAVLRDASLHREFLDDAVSRKIATVSDSEWVLYYYTDSPWPIPDNDCVTRMRYSKGAEPEQASFHLTAAPGLLASASVPRITRYDMRYDLQDAGDGKTRITMAADIVPTFKVPAWMVRKNFPQGPGDILHKLIRLASKNPALSRGGEP